MATTNTLPPGTKACFDYVIVGGGTAGCVIASRLSGYLPHKRVLLIEAGPCDLNDPRALILKQRVEMQGTELEYRYKSVHQPRGNSHIVHSRAKILGGCSSHNDMVSLRTPAYDALTWEHLGCKGWSFDTFTRLQNKLRLQTYPGAHPRDRNDLCRDWIRSAHRAMDIPFVPSFNDAIASPEGLAAGAGWTPLSYNPDNGSRSSASVAYIHPVLRGDEQRPGLTILTHAWVNKVNVQNDVAVSVEVRLEDGSCVAVYADSEVILCAGAYDTPRLMLLSGLGPRKHLEDVNVPVVKDIPGVGENLQDHPCSVIVFNLHSPVPTTTATHSDVLAFLRCKPENFTGEDGNLPDLLLHMWQLEFCSETSRAGYPVPENPFCMLPVVLRPESRGRVYLHSSDPQAPPAIDFKYYEDPRNYDAELLVAGIKAARKMAMTEPLKSWIKEEVAPGSQVTSDQDLDRYARSVSHTMYHPACTAKMGDFVSDPLAVVDSKLQVRGVKNLRVADASVFPTMVTINLMLTVLAVGERAAEMIAEDAGWKGLHARL